MNSKLAIKNYLNKEEITYEKLSMDISIGNFQWTKN